MSMFPTANKNTDLSGSSDDTRVSVSSRGIEIKRRGRPVGGEVSGNSWMYLAIDCSASMAGTKLSQAKRGAIDFFPEAREKGYAVGLVSFDTHSTHICEPQRDLDVIRRYLEKLGQDISTDMADGIDIISIGTDDADREFLERLATRSDLSVIVPSDTLGQGIASSARMLPGTGGGQALPGP